MSRWKKALLFAILFVLLLCLVGPLFLPSPGAEQAIPAPALADADSQFVNVLGYELHYKEIGTGQPVLILLHGFGANLYTWRKVMQPLSEYGRVIAFDRIGAGLSAHPVAGNWEQKSPYAPSMQPEFLIALMDELGVEQAILIGHSQGGAVALNAALLYPERVTALILADPAIYTSGGPPIQFGWLWRTPQMQKIGPWVAHRFLGEANAEQLIALAWHDPSRFSTQERDETRRLLRVKNQSAALWEYTVANEPDDLPQRLGDVELPVLVMAGDDDRIVPTAEHVRLTQELPDAEFVLIEDCGHLPHEEQPEEFMRAVILFLDSMSE
jgi:pimeloyl-ACP methyl ester carboxylesterase